MRTVRRSAKTKSREYVPGLPTGEASQRLRLGCRALGGSVRLRKGILSNTTTPKVAMILIGGQRALIAAANFRPSMEPGI